MEAEPIWPVLVLVGFQVLDAVSCAIPTRFITAALDRVDCPQPIRRILPTVKLASAVGLVIGLWVPAIGLLTIAALVAYFVAAIVFHVRARDTLLSTSGAVVMLVAVVVVGTCYL